MTKQEFVDRVADKSGLSKRDAADAVDAFLDTITDVLRGRGEVAFTGSSPACISARMAEVHDPGARSTPGRQPEKPIAAGGDPRDDRSEVLRGQPAQAGSKERRRRRRHVALS